MTLEYLSQNAIRINNQVLNLSVYDPPLKDGNSHLVEATSQISDKFGQQLQVSELEGLTGGMLPKGFELTIYWPQARFKNVVFVKFGNLSKGPCITLSSFINFYSWDQRKNLIDFANRLSTKIETTIEKCLECDIDKDEISIYIHCTFSLDLSDDCYREYSRIDRELCSLYKKALADDEMKLEQGLLTKHETTEKGGRWWIRT